jgi:DNA-binding NarL/FixJ family response regulator
MAGIRLRDTTVVARLLMLNTSLGCVTRSTEEHSLTDTRPTIVFADDNVKVAQVACTLLDSAYKIVKIAADGEEAARCIQELKPDFAVLDISMPKLDGITLARQLHDTGSNTLVVFVTLIDDEDYIEEARTIGHGYVLKRRMSFDLLPALSSARKGLFFCSH